MWKCKEWCYIQLTLGIWCGPLSQHPLPPARHQPHPLTPSTQTIIQEETKDSEKRPNSQQIVSYCLGLHTQNPGLREVDFEHSPKRGSDKINRLRPRRKIKKFYPLGLMKRNNIYNKSTFLTLLLLGIQFLNHFNFYFCFCFLF